MVGIYKITNIVNNKVYVGQSVDITERWKQHQYKAFNCNEIAYNSAIQAAFRKYGIENFLFEVLEECEIEELDEKEREWISKLNTLSPNGYNILVGGQKVRAKRLCINCGKPLKSGAKKYCLDCYKENMRIGIPSKEELYQKIVDFQGNFTKAGNYYKVSDNAVRNWCKSYNLPYHSKDYK